MTAASTGNYQTDAEGYLVEPGDWNETVAQQIADTYSLKLGPDHWEVIRFIRDNFEQHHVAPDARHVMKFLKDKHNNEDGRARLYRLFPYGYMQQTCKIAGMRRPRAWSTG